KNIKGRINLITSDSLKKLKPVQISKNVNDYSALVYGPPKVGKTSFVYDLYKDKVLYLATEDRHKALAGAKVQPIASWADYENVLVALEDEDLKEEFDVICVDTIENLYDMCEKAILKKYRVKNLSDVAWGKAHGDLKNTWKIGINMISKI